MKVQYNPRNMHTVFALLCFVVVIHWLIFPYPSGLLHWHCGNLTIAPVPAKHPWWIWIDTSREFIMNDYVTTTKQSKTKPCAYFLGYTVWGIHSPGHTIFKIKSAEMAKSRIGILHNSAFMHHHRYVKCPSRCMFLFDDVIMRFEHIYTFSEQIRMLTWKIWEYLASLWPFRSGKWRMRKWVFSLSLFITGLQ